MTLSPIENTASGRAYLDRIGATMRNLFSAVVQRKEFGYDKDVGRIRFNRDGTVSADYGYEPTAEEAAAIASEVSALDFPVQQSVKSLSPANLPDNIKFAKSKDLFEYYDKDGNITFLQVRIDLENGDKRYVPYTYWSDGEWRTIEPESGLPIYNLQKVRKGDRVFLHEGAKAARAAEEICDNLSHPWSEYLSTGVHVGWIGGAHHVRRSKWGSLTPLPGELIIVPDNDFVGKLKVAEISQMFECPTFYFKLDASWPKAWDLADPIPKSMFKIDPESGGATYNGPSFSDLIEPCDWATEQYFIEGSEKPHYKIREPFAQNWVRIQNTQQYAHLSAPDKTWSKDQFNFQVRPYSDVHDTALLLAKVSGNIVDKATFRPDMPTGLVRVDGDYCLNQYYDMRTKPERHDGSKTTPFWEFMEYIFPNEDERLVVTRWMATLYAKPEIRMGFGLLLLSKMQGIGKSTLLNIFAELIGRRQSSFPGDSMIQSDFNGWLVNKRFIAVHEIYAGQNWKTYNRLKSLITEDVIEANNKHVANYQLPNWSHYAAASNSMEALRIENDDRRWFVPLLATSLYLKYQELHDWLRSGGLRFLAHDLLQRNDYLSSGDKAPYTEAKAALIDQSMPTDERMTLTCAERMSEGDCMDAKEIWLWLQGEANMRAFVSPQRIAGLLREHGFHTETTKVGDRPRVLVWRNKQELEKAVSGKDEDEAERIRANRIKMPSEVFRENKVM